MSGSMDELNIYNRALEAYKKAKSKQFMMALVIIEKKH